MSRECSKCGKVYSNNEYKYCPNCAGELRGTKSSFSSYDPTPPSGYVYDYGGHLRPDLDRLEKEKKELEEAFKNRW
jgi:predicted amidophosphoribosyltransferase